MYLQFLPLYVFAKQRKNCELALDLEKGCSIKKVDTGPIKLEGLNEEVFEPCWLITLTVGALLTYTVCQTANAFSCKRSPS